MLKSMAHKVKLHEGFTSAAHSMGELTTKHRNALPNSAFGLPGSRKYPMPNRSHAGNAKARATQMVNRGKLSPASAARIRAKANRILGKSK